MLKSLSSYKALDKGAKLWVLSFDPKEFWFKKINWRMRFLLCSPLSDRTSDRPVLLSVKGKLPTQQILCLPKGEEDWVIACHRNWKQLGRPSLRVFLPRGLNPEMFAAKWPEEKAHDILSCVCGAGESFSTGD
ncbi:MAG: hypothetical protein OXB86_03810 [Bdellovibrionales bacterium]|nr:hypothetical protein [Bdellovibrionales bacterium]